MSPSIKTSSVETAEEAFDSDAREERRLLRKIDLRYVFDAQEQHEN
jgi:hypothetical protein